MNFVTMMALIVSSTLVYSAPLILASLGGVYSENSGIVNIGLEGIMTMGAFAAIVFNLTFASTFGAATPWLGTLVGGIVGLIFSLLHAVATINFHADHVISGTVLNIMAPPLGVFLIKAIYDKGQTENITANFGYFSFWFKQHSHRWANLLQKHLCPCLDCHYSCYFDVVDFI